MLHGPEPSPLPAVEAAYWSKPADALLADLKSEPNGLSSAEAARRLAACGANAIGTRRDVSAIGALARQFRSPLVLILIFAAIVSAFVGEGSEAAIIGAIVLASCLLSFTQEYGASRAMEALKARIGRRASVLRDGAAASVAVEEIVPGDVVALSAGNLVPADGVLLAARDFNVSEATLTGETFPVVKAPGTSAPDAQIGQRGNAVFTGTSVRSGTATMLVARWNIAFVRRFMLTFGLVSSAFDFLTFGFLLFVLKATEATFQTGWFVESLVTQLAIVLVIRTRKAFWKSRPGRLLSWLTLVVALAAVAIPYLPGADLFGFVPPPAAAMAGIGVITALYLAASETAKRWFFSRQRRHRRRPFRR